MYGLVNCAVQDMVLAKFGEPSWQAVKERAGVDVATFVAMSPYPDKVTYDLVGAATEVLGLDAATVLEAFGEFWMEYSAQVGYGDLLAMMGHDLPSFLEELDHMHDRLRLSFPELNPPSLYLSDVEPDRFLVHYVSDRPGLTPFVVGLLRGAGRRFGQTVEVSLRQGRTDGHDHDVFDVRIVPAA